MVFFLSKVVNRDSQWCNEHTSFPLEFHHFAKNTLLPMRIYILSKNKSIIHVLTSPIAADIFYHQQNFIRYNICNLIMI
jgi:hypothetical protein